MGKALVITEKPSVARDIVAALGGFQEQDGFWEREDYVITFSVGHLLELLGPEALDPKYKSWTLDTLPIIPDEFKLSPKSGTSERVRTIKKLLARPDIDGVINACDAGREGELIFREIVEYLESTKPIQRLWLQSMTQNAIRTGFENLAPGEEYDGLHDAAVCRSRSDWLIGMNATRALTRRLQSRKEKTAWSAGRVQTPTLALMVDREIEVLAHVARPFWRIEARFSASGSEYAGTWIDPEFSASDSSRDEREDRIFEEARALQVVEAVRGQSGEASETRKPSRETAPPLFDLTSLQRVANQRFSWSARRTLNATQRCYEAHKVLTYPRTGSRCLPSDYGPEVDRILNTFAEAGPFQGEAAYLLEHGLENSARTFDNSKVSDHFAVVPTGQLPSEPLTGDDGRIFDLVSRRFLANFYPAALWNRVERRTEVAGQVFRSRSRTLDEPGWRQVMGQTEQEEQALPALVAGESEASGVATRTLEVETEPDETKPPPRISEARLLSLMESAGRELEDEELAEAMKSKGIGTPATRADVIENLIRKGYVVRVGKSLRPTVKAIRLVETLKRIQIGRLASPELTGEMEFRLQEVQRNERTPEQFMKEMTEYTLQIVDRARTFDYEELYPDGPVGTCPCQEKRPVFERAWFYRCEEKPDVEREDDCPFRIWKDKSGRYMDRTTVKTLLEKGETRVLDGFMYRDGRTYKGTLRIEDKELKLDRISDGSSEQVSSLPEYEVAPEPLGPCPVGCESEVIETSTHYLCRSTVEKQQEQEKTEEKPAKGDRCSFILPRTVCKREIVRDEAEAYLRDRRTSMLEDFTSRFGRPFSATLFIKENGRHGFEFAPRKAGAKKASRKKGTSKKATRKKTTRKKTTRKKTTRKKASTKKAAAKK
ncbi:MAG: DNA topoisomerase 3 [Myxococcota bacterium]|nr:DNA topoisomerase 3 [Myxococcota bacterium]